MKLTNRGIIYTNWDCNLDCPFCYYKFKEKFQRPLRDIKADLIKAKFYYKLDWVDISGGEPLVYKYIEEVLKFCKIIGLKVTLITNGILINEKIDDLVDEWLISIHGTKETHDKMIGKPVFNIVERNIKNIKKPFRVNVVVTKDNYKNFPEHAKYLSELNHKPLQVQYIMFNPFHEFVIEPKIDFLVHPNDLAIPLHLTIEKLKENDIKTVVRYLPFCMLKGHEDVICGMSQIAWDKKEWDWCQQLNLDVRIRDENQYYKISRNTVIGNSCHHPKCSECSLRFICDGISMTYLKHFNDLDIEPYIGKVIFNPIHFKRGEKKC